MVGALCFYLFVYLFIIAPFVVPSVYYCNYQFVSRPLFHSAMVGPSEKAIHARTKYVMWLQEELGFHYLSKTYIHDLRPEKAVL